MEFTEAMLTQVQVVLAPRPVQLEGVEVVGERGDPRLERSGFYYRKHTNAFGTFIDEREIEQRRRTTNRLSDLLQGVPGITIDNANGSPTLYSTRGADSIEMGRCKPAVYIDGFRVASEAPGGGGGALASLNNIDLLIPVQDIAAIEVYASGVTTPPEFGMGKACAAVAIWTKSG